MPDSSPSKLESDRQLLRDAQARGAGATLGAYAKLSGPGWLQSAITLGGGSLASSLYLGVLGGYELLWLQPIAMILGIIMLSAIAYVTTTTGERPFKAINEHVSPVLGWGWLLAALLANMVWCLPQFSLASGVVQQNLLPGVLGPGSALGDFNGKLIITAVVLLITVAITWSYESGSWGIKLYERMLKLMVAAIVLCFVGVVFKLSTTGDGVRWGEVLAGFIPDFSKLTQPASGFDSLLAAVPGEYRQFWTDLIVHEQRSVMISAAATAVGINMTFLFPYSMLAKGWTREFRGLAVFDLSTGMFIPYVLATSCVVVAAASQFHPKPDLTVPTDGLSAPILFESRARPLELDRLKDQIGDDAYVALSDAERDAQRVALSPAERKLAEHLTRRDAFDLARSLKPLTGQLFANIIFGLGVLAMTLSTISLLMLISGFCVCEMLGVESRGWPHRLGTLAAVTGVLGPFVWAGEARFYLAVPTSMFGMVLLPIAYLTFFLLMNQRSLLGADMPSGGRRLAWNLLMGIAALTAVGASIASINASGGEIAGFPVKYWGFAGAGGFLLLALVVHFLRRPSPNNDRPT